MRAKWRRLSAVGLSRSIATSTLLVLFMAKVGVCQTVVWDDGATDNPPPGDGISWNDVKNWEDDTLPSGVIGAVISTDRVRVQDGFLGVAATLSAGATTLEIDGALTIQGAFDSDGEIFIASANDSPTSGAGLRVGGGALMGDATIYLQRSSSLGVNPAVFEAIGDLTIGVDYEVRGEGWIGADVGAELINEGLVVAENRDSNSGSNLELFGLWTNNADVRSSPAAGVTITTTGLTQGATGSIVADTSNIDFVLGAVAGGSLESVNGGRFVFGVDGSLGDLTNNGLIDVTTGSTQIDLNISGSGITNNGTITINSDNQQGNAAINFLTTSTLRGGGEIVLNRQNLGESSSLGAKLISGPAVTVMQQANHTIRGEGQLQAALINNGVVEAVDANGDGHGVLLVTNTGGGASNPTNNHIFRANDGAMIDLNGRLDQSATGRLIASDGGLVQLRSATVTGGALETEGEGVVELATTSSLVDVRNSGVLNLPGGGSQARLNIRGAGLTNDGTLTVNSDAVGGALLVFEESLTLDGAGQIVLPEQAVSRLSIDFGVTLTQSAGHTITGEGRIEGAGVLINNGTVEGETTTEPLEILGRVGGDGTLRNVKIFGTHAPGESTASVPIEGAYVVDDFSGRLEIDIGGDIAGDDYDQLVSTDPANVITIESGLSRLDVFLIDGFVPSSGDRFTIISTAGSVGGGGFTFENLPENVANFAISWLPVEYNESSVVLEVAGITALPGDYNADGVVDAADFTVWRDNDGATGLAPWSPGDGDGDGDVNSADYDVWVANFGATLPASSLAVPEPAAIYLTLAALSYGLIRRRR